MVIEVVKFIALFLVGFYAHRWMFVNQCSKETRLIFWVFFIRFILASFHYATYPKIIGPFSLVSLYSMALVSFLFVYFIRNGIVIRTDASFVFVGMILTLMMMSAIFNSHYIGSIASIVKWVLLLQLINLIIYAIGTDGWNKVTLSIGFSYLYPILMLVISIVLGVSKATENDGSISFVGGFKHEAVFSVIVFSGMAIFLMRSVIANNIRWIVGSTLVMLTLLMFINYRTTILASLATLLMLGLMAFRNISLFYRVVFASVIALISLLVLSLDNTAIIERFNEIPQVIASSDNFKMFPEFYNNEEKRFFSGRIYFWSSYISAALEGSTIQFWFGHGMDAWKDLFEKYAHNTFVSFFYELGMVGLFVLLSWFIYLVYKSFQGNNRNLSYLLFGLSLSFVVLNVATMPLWQIEGIFILSILVSLINENANRQVN